MQKYVIPTAIAVLAAFIALLVACGEGEPNNLDQAELDKIKSAMLRLQDSIAACGKNPDSPSCPNENGSSSGEDGTSSSDDGSSNPGGTSSSSSGNNNDNSSDSSSNSSASSKPPEFDKDCPADKRPMIPNFTCSWKPASVQGGDTAKLGLSISPVSDTTMTCAPNKAWRALFGCNAGVSPENCIKRDTAYFLLDKDMVTSGVYKDMKSGGKNMPSASKEWPKEGNFVVNGTINCTGIDSKGAGYSCRRTLECEPLNIEPAPAPKLKDKVKLTCDWPVFTTGITEGIDGYLSKGAKLEKPCELKEEGTNNSGLWLIANNKEAGCKSLVTKYCGESTYGDCSTSKVGDTVTVKVIATCKGGDYTLKELTYKVVADPVLNGTCKWLNPIDNTDLPISSGNTQVTTTGRGALPIGLTLLNSYGRCGAGVTNNTSYTLQVKDYVNGSTSWPSNGAWPSNGGRDSLTATTYSSVKPNITCTPAINPAPVNCPPLIVTKGGACNGELNMATLCPSVAWSTIKWNVRPVRENNKVTEGCYWVESWPGTTDKGFASITNYRINGTQYSGNGKKDNWDANKVDGGIYIYIPSNTQGDPQSADAIITGTNPPFCKNPVESLTCSLPVGAATGDNIASKVTSGLKCYSASGAAPQGIVWSPSVNWSNIDLAGSQAGTTHNLTVNGTCDSKPLSANCSIKIYPSGTRVCGYESSWCKGKYTTASAVPRNTLADNDCIFVTGISKFCSNGSGSLINGKSVGQGNIGCWANTSLSALGITVVDGGYYIYKDGGTGDNTYNLTTGTAPACDKP